MIEKKNWLCWIGLHKWRSLADTFAFGRRWKHRECSRCGKEQFV